MLSARLSFTQGERSFEFTRADSLRGSLNAFRDCYDVKYYDLYLKVMPGSRTIAGCNRITMKSTRDFNRLQLDLFANMHIDSVLFSGKQLPVTREGNAFYVQFPGEIHKGEIIDLAISYHGQPLIANHPPWDGGFTWAKDSLNRDWIGVSCQGIGASLWWPNKDHLSDRPDSMRITLEVPEELTGVSNGRLTGKTPGSKGYTRWIWGISYPINNYNVSINVAHYLYFSDRFMGQEGILDLNYYVLDYNLEKARDQFQQVKPMLQCYEHYLGPYPFMRDGYKLVETPYYGMEHQSGIAYGNDFQNNEFGFDYIIVHESGHEYWGNNVAVEDLAELWVHESFTTYMESLYIEYFQGKAQALDYLATQKPVIHNLNPMLGPRGVNYDNWMDADIYYKGAWMLHSIRSTLADDPGWFALLRSIQQHFRHRTVSSAEIIDFMEDHTEYTLRPIFDQFLTSTGIPVLWVRERKKKEHLILRYKWKKAIDDFNMPVDVRYDGQVTRLYPNRKKQELVLDRIDQQQPEFAEDLFYFQLRKK